MPYESDKQRRFMHAKHPKIAARWDNEYGTTPAKKQKPVKRSKKKPTSPKTQARKKKGK